tara:strand:- start:2262 stop:2822 length:561 start_codon:yes stop_codon:yes gene_type:complete
MEDIFDDIFDTSQALAGVDAEVGKSLSQLVKQVTQLDKKIDDWEGQIKILKDQRKRITHDRIPSLMDEMGVEKIEVEGASVSCKPVVHASIPVPRKEEAFAWLRENGLDGIIKNDVVVTFGKGEDNIAGNLVGQLQEKGFDPKTKTHIHASTLKAFVKERVTAGKHIDLDMFGAFVSSAAEIKRKA